MNVRPCGIDGCRVCRPRPVFEEPSSGMSLPELLVSAAMLVAVIVLFAVLLPVLA